jgi:hypothetical protein
MATMNGELQHGEAVDVFARINKAKGQVHLHARRKQRHDARPSLLGVASEGGFTSVICTATNTGVADDVSSCFQRNRTRAAIP